MSNESEAQRVLREVEKRKQRANELGIEELILYLFFGRGYGSFGSYKIKGASLISDFSHNINTGQCKFTLNKRNYSVSETQNEFPGRFEILVDGGKVLAVEIMADFTPFKDDTILDGVTKYRCSAVKAFVEGEWVRDLKTLVTQIELDEKEAERKKEEDPKRIRKLKEDFGIE